MLSLTHEAASTLSLRGDMRLSRREGSWVNLNRLKQPPASPSPLTLSFSLTGALTGCGTAEEPNTGT